MSRSLIGIELNDRKADGIEWIKQFRIYQFPQSLRNALDQFLFFFLENIFDYKKYHSY